jgi:chromosome segregation ATPase
MIKNLEVINFRNIKHQKFDLGKTNLFVGMNKLGKSNLLNALNVLLTGSLLTDKYGSDEKDIQSIIPYGTDANSNEESVIKVTLTSGTEYQMNYKRNFDKYGKCKGHEAKFYINGGKVTQKEFYPNLYGALGFQPVFTKLKIDDSRLMTDPLYALLKLDYKDLRALLVAMGCSISDEELKEQEPNAIELIDEVKTKYQGDYTRARKSYKDAVANTNKSLESCKSQLKLFNDVEEFNPSTLDELKEERNALNELNGKYKNTTNENAIINLENKKQQLLDKIDDVKNKQIQVKSLEILDLKEKINNIKALNENAKKEHFAQGHKQIETEQSELHSLERSLADTRLKLTIKENELKSLQIKGKGKQDMIKAKSNDLANLKEHSKFMVVCPYCNQEHEAMLPTSVINIQTLTNAISILQDELDGLKGQYKATKQEADSLTNKVNELSTQVFNKQSLVNQLIKDIQEAEANYKVDTIELDALNMNLQELEAHKYDVVDNEEIVDLKNQIETINSNITELKENNVNPYEADIEANNQRIAEIDQLMSEQYILKNKWDNKVELQNTHKAILEELNNKEFALNKINDVIRTMIAMINDKAKLITGFDFVMLEENLTNDDIKEVCYVTVDGVPFKDLNTADKIKVGISFIETCRRIAQQQGASDNQLPILVDRLEGIDTIDAIKKLTNIQLIGTRVNDTDTTIRLEILD